MSVTNIVEEIEEGLREPQNSRDARVEKLWASLEPDHTGELDLKGLQKGLRRIDHPMKNADDMLKRIMEEVDQNGDGKIQYNAFKNAGLTLSNRRLTEFFDDMDLNNDGYVTFDEWRNFLLFMPPHDHDSQLHAVLDFYYSVVSVTPEGDTLVSEETLEGLGTDGFRSLFITLFGSLLRVAFPYDFPRPIPSPDRTSTSVSQPNTSNPDESSNKTESMATAAAVSYPDYDDAATEISQELAETLTQHVDDGTPGHEHTTGASTAVHKKFRLTQFVPDPGYFLAGAIAGGVSRTATAPLDRLKVYLLVNTSSRTETAGAALRQGRPIAALKNAAKPFGDAVRDLVRSGGVRSLFAGKCHISNRVDGNGLNVVKIMPETAIKFGSYEAAKRALANFEGHGDPKNLSSWSKFASGGLAGMIAQASVYPLDTLKFRLQCETVKDGLQGAALVRQTAVKMYADGGVRACYRGLTMGLVGMFPYSAIDMGTFELLKKSYKTYYARKNNVHEDDVKPGNIATGIIGATSGAFGASVVYPLNVVRTRLQTQGTAMHPATYTGIWDVTKKTIQREGYRGLYKGLTPNLLKVAPALSITWVVYENSKRILGLS
ncbi:peroxisomal Ca-dependent solute carrier [Fusarium beomiforme]|uniref:Mitochondrial thiamine pyrophosphate carrier 1 n=1 Tax=Fusarium beomiforme TaxID=44412 RepID=A0A9P5ADQ5_9HYPO|nr:peroxisomal Ca-dependent solute carrier [Fusarium beomiforme]